MYIYIYIYICIHAYRYGDILGCATVVDRHPSAEVSFCRHGSCTFTEVARLVPSGRWKEVTELIDSGLLHTCHILPPSGIDLGLRLAVFAGSGGKYLFHRIG